MNATAEKKIKGDALAIALHGMDVNKLYRVAKANKLSDRVNEPTDDDHAGRYRMRVGNLLRGKVRRGEPVKVGTAVISDL